METRLKILYDAQVIDSAVYCGMLNVLTRLEQHWQLSIRHPQGEMLITHMANALMRASQRQVIPAIDDEILKEIEATAIFANIREINNDLLSLFVFEVPDHELGYLLVNLYGLHLAQQMESE
ncbi:PRD domain-containing protein [Yersinia thracica]|nr:PRD domain-containing protein [Yersinia thracica]